jgi:TonB family protein
VPPPEKKKKKPNKEVKKTAERKKITQPPIETPTADTLETAAEPATTGDVQLSVEDFPFAYYVSSMKRKIAAYWEVPTSGQESMYCVVYFRVRRDGSLESLSVEKGSGQFLFDQAALRAITRANPLPPLPDGFKENYLGVHFTFAYEREF